MNAPDLVLAAAAVALGSIVQSISGVGGGFIMVPLLAMIDVGFLPGPMIFATLSLSTLMAWRERQHIDYANLGPIILATFPGTFVGAWVLAGMPPDRLGLIFGSMILVAIGISVAGLHPPLNRWTGAAAGFIAGTMGASSGIGAPALAVFYHRQPAPTVRATLGLLYTVASLIIVAVLAGFGRFGLADAQTGFLLMPGMLFGYLLSRTLAVRFDRAGMRYVVLAVSGLAAVTLMIKSL